MLLSNQIRNNMKWNGGGGGGCGNELLGVTSNKQSLHSPDGAAFMNPYAHTVCLECNYINVYVHTSFKSSLLSLTCILFDAHYAHSHKLTNVHKLMVHTHTHIHVHTPPTHTHIPPPPPTHTHSPPPPLLLLESAPHWTLHVRRAVSASPSPLLRPVRETIAPPLAVTARVMWQGCTQCTMLCPDVPLLRPGTKPTLLARCVCAYWDGGGNFDVAIQRSVFDRSLCQFLWLISGQSNRQFRRLNRRKVLAFSLHVHITSLSVTPIPEGRFSI